MFTIDKVRLMHVAMNLGSPPPSEGRGNPDLSDVHDSQGMSYLIQMEQKLGITPPPGAQFDTRVRMLETTLNPLCNTKKQIVAFHGFYSVALCKLNPDLFFVFGDNMQRVGMGGQAVIRQQPNIIGVATKRDPGNGFMSDSPFDMSYVMVDLLEVDRHIANGQRVVVPITKEGRVSLGCGLAELPYRAPLVYATIERWFRSLKGVEIVK
jgi:hypothetical protein